MQTLKYYWSRNRSHKWHPYILKCLQNKSGLGRTNLEFRSLAIISGIYVGVRNWVISDIDGHEECAPREGGGGWRRGEANGGGDRLLEGERVGRILSIVAALETLPAIQLITFTLVHADYGDKNEKKTSVEHHYFRRELPRDSRIGGRVPPRFPHPWVELF